MNTQALIFANLLNGVSEQQVAEAFKISREEVQRTFAFVLRKVKSYCFLRQTQKAYPTITACTPLATTGGVVRCLGSNYAMTYTMTANAPMFINA